MNSRYEIYPSSHAVVASITGPATVTGLMAFIHELWADPRYSPKFDGFVDLTAGDVSLEMRDLRPMLDYILRSPHTTVGRWATVTHSPLATACGFIYRRALSARHGFEVFSTRSAACEFVGFSLAPGELFGSGNEPRRL